MALQTRERLVNFFELFQWVRKELVQDVPEELAICKFDCRKSRCSQDDWIRCKRRILLPEPSPVGILR